jgi:hypothetical protein
MDKHDVMHLERQIKELGGTLTSLADDKDFQEFITIIHRPGWRERRDDRGARARVAA